MTRLFLALFVLVSFSCNTKQTQIENENVAGQSAAMEQELQINAIFLELRETPNKFMILALIQNETGITSFSKGDTVSLYPNFIHRDGVEANAKSPENEHMASLQNLAKNSAFKATIRIRGKGEDRHGLIIKWEN